MSATVPAGPPAATRVAKVGKPVPTKPLRRAPSPDVIARDDDLFHDGKDAGALRTIGEVAAALGLRQHVLRYWEEQFPMLRPLTRAGARRYYRPEDIALLIQIDRLLHRDGYTIRGARQALMRPVARRAAPGPVRGAPLLDVIEGTPVVQPVQGPPSGQDPSSEQALGSALAVLRHHLESIRQRLSGALAKA